MSDSQRISGRKGGEVQRGSSVITLKARYDGTQWIDSDKSDFFIVS